MEHTVTVIPENVEIGYNMLPCNKCDSIIFLKYDGEYFSAPDTNDVVYIEYVGDKNMLPKKDVDDIYDPLPLKLIESEPEYEEKIDDETRIPYKYIVGAIGIAIVSSGITILAQHIRW